MCERRRKKEKAIATIFFLSSLIGQETSDRPTANFDIDTLF
jgi:hypothetical protein